MHSIIRDIARCGRNHGFTVLEIIAVLVVLGIMAVLTVTRIASTASYTIASEVDTIKIYLRYAQYRALSDNANWGMTFTGNSCTMQRNGMTAPFNLPNESSAIHTFASGITVSGTNVTFDEWGSPGIADTTIMLASGNETKTITISKNTGFIP